MSGITPIIDTLLHQVLGRRDAPVERPLPDTLILPAQPGQAAARAYSDSRLDPRAPLPTRTRGAPASKAEAAAPQARASPTPEADDRIAAAIRFSSAARTIAEVLARFPPPPTALRVAAPLLAQGEPVDAARLAALLRASIETSGLFYEAHLKRWRGGGLSIERLRAEPQMRLTTAATVPTDTPQSPLATRAQIPAAPLLPTAAPQAQSIDRGTAPTPAGGDHAVPAPPTTAAPIALAYAADGKALSPPPPAAASAGGEPPIDPAWPAPNHGNAGAHAGLDGLLRQQLEMLAVPVLHWEGVPWPSAFMTLSLQPPAWRDDSGHGHDDAEARHARKDTSWQSQLVLRLARLGEIKVGVRLDTRRVALDLAAHPDAAARMQAGSADLDARLTALGFEDVSVQVRASAMDPGDAPSRATAEGAPHA